jgi:hypothetical protein
MSPEAANTLEVRASLIDALNLDVAGLAAGRRHED